MRFLNWKKMIKKNSNDRDYYNFSSDSSKNYPSIDYVVLNSKAD